MQMIFSVLFWLYIYSKEKEKQSKCFESHFKLFLHSLPLIPRNRSVIFTSKYS